ncbi:hypothetical protein [Cecembia rubra]|uniref:Uncharacterized protein n=1 Tax=Cecembia rubra TaxID=1485585 RepID=A0A2P8DYC0_9BACT|nr:hypothetical protein [Cecembia rubra]PSL02225.1 hypothetical protein CLV48_1107 [Cecembia rubra]
MAKSMISNKMASFSIRYRAICEDDSFKGPWRSHLEEAYQDARVHRQKAGNETHIIRILTEQTMSLTFEE